MISSTREKGFQAKQENENSDKFPKAASSSRQWSGFRNPRIVRVSRAFGGKDRHSKVCTVRGLRDRRIRLSVPTAIQLYDLQDRLGLSQPSKVIDWLLDAAKHDIDKLPPLQITQGFGQFHQQMIANSHETHASPSSLSPFVDASSSFFRDGEQDQTLAAKRYWDLEAAWRAKDKEVQRESMAEKGKWIQEKEEDQDQDEIGDYSGQPSAQNFFPTSNQPSFAGLLSNSVPFNSYYHWEPSSLSLSQYGFLSQPENSLNNNALTLPSSLSLPSGPQFFFYPPSGMPSLFPTSTPYVSPPPTESDSRQLNHFQLLSSSSSQPFLSPTKPFSFNVNVGLTNSENVDESHHPNKANTNS